jgi:hypothetical protein
MEDRLRWFTQWSRVKELWQCAACRQYSNSKDFQKMIIEHKKDCKYMAMLKEAE